MLEDKVRAQADRFLSPSMSPRITRAVRNIVDFPLEALMTDEGDTRISCFFPIRFPSL